MKNTFKRLISAMLAVIMALGCISAFAAEETIEWYWNSYGEEDEFMYEMPCLGELTAGENTVGKDRDEDDIEDDGEQTCYRFTAESDGYYLITLGDLEYFYNNYVYFSEAFVDGKAYSLVYDEYSQRMEDSIEFIYYLSAGETAVLIQSVEEFTLTYEFLGEEITDIVYDENSLEGILNSDFYSYRDYSYGYGICGDLIFSSGKKFRFADYVFVIEEKIVKGENTVEFEFFGFKKDVIVNVVEARDVITKLEPVNLEDDLVVIEHYNGYVSADDIGEADLIITYADGRKETVDFDGGDAIITLPNGRKYWVAVVYDRETLTADLIFASEVYETYDLKKVPAELDENTQELKSENSNWINQANRDLEWRLERLEYAGSWEEKFSLVFWIPGLYTNAIFQIFCNIVEFVEYYANLF
ncbi:MAG: hypothetical protein IJZ07_00085 [Clostridia bacterium]|nr:hypothetical protein [Clostridia bacterium]